MAYFPCTRFDFREDTSYYYPLTFEYDNLDKVKVVVSNVKGQAISLTYGVDYTLESDKVHILNPSFLKTKYSLEITKIFAIRFSGICVTPEFNYGVYVDVRKIQKTLEAMSLQLAEVQMTSENSVKLAYEEWENSNEDPVVQIPTISERAGRIMAFDGEGKVLMIREADLAQTMQKYIKSAKDPVAVDVSCLSYTFPALYSGYIDPEEYKKFESEFKVVQGDIEYTAIERDIENPPDKATFSLNAAATNISGFEVDKEFIRGTELTEMTEDAASITVLVYFRDLEGYVSHFTKIISFSKTKTGPKGEDAKSFTIKINSTNGMVFRVDQAVETTLSIQVLAGTEDITDSMDNSRFKWIRKTGNEIEDEKWNTSSKALYHKAVDITTEDCLGRTVFECEVDLDNL